MQFRPAQPLEELGEWRLEPFSLRESLPGLGVGPAGPAFGDRPRAPKARGGQHGGLCF